MHNAHGHHEPPATTENYEPTDAHVGPILALGIVLVLVTVASFIAGYILLKYSTERAPMSAFETSPLVSERQEWKAGDVRLQVDLRADLERYEAVAKPALTSYGVVSDQPEIYHFPIEQAIDHVADHGMPVFKPFGDGSLEGAVTN